MVFVYFHLCRGKLTFCYWWLQVYTWGKGYCGALGHGDEIDKTTPELLIGLKNDLAVQVKRSSHLLTRKWNLLLLQKTVNSMKLEPSFCPALLLSCLKLLIPFHDDAWCLFPVGLCKKEENLCSGGRWFSLWLWMDGVW